jgi:hypothetical protein
MFHIHTQLATIPEIGYLKYRELLQLQTTFDEEKMVTLITKILTAKSEGMASKRKKLLTIGKQAGEKLEKLFFGGKQ